MHTHTQWLSAVNNRIKKGSIQKGKQQIGQQETSRPAMSITHSPDLQMPPAQRRKKYPVMILYPHLLGSSHVGCHRVRSERKVSPLLAGLCNP
ncbi:hypothetical protein FKM82_002963 [Ascaphus truei]